MCRDREEELAEFARALKMSARATPLGRTAIVFQRPLPYLYLARQVFQDAQLPYQALDSLPLAAEPFAAAVDLVFSAIAADFTRGALVELLRSPHFAFTADGHTVTPDDVHALDRYLVKRKYLGDATRLAALALSDAPSRPSDAAAQLRWKRRGGRGRNLSQRRRADFVRADRRHPRVHAGALKCVRPRATPGSPVICGPARPSSPRCRC